MVTVCFVCFAFDCVGELFVECVCYLCGEGDCLLLESDCVVFGLCWCFVFQRVGGVCDPSVCLGVHSICLICVFV